MIGQIISITHKLVRFLVPFSSVGPGVCNTPLVEIYDDKDDAMKDEIAALGGQTATETNVFSAFYDRLKEIREYYSRYPSARVLDTTDEYEQLLEVKPHIEFSAEEAYGRYPDMQYKEYLSTLTEYLVYFFERTEPLLDLDRLFSKALGALGLKTGGTIQQRAQRLFLTKHTPLEKLDKRHYAKGAPRFKQNGPVASQHQNDDSKRIAFMEIKIEKLCEILHEKIMRTKGNVEKKQGQTCEEIDAEMKDEELPDVESDNEDRQIYNPLKLPVGWDGKPIPYWVYKLHGLGQEFKCEICGDCSYRGRRAYELHFKESRHQYGMRRLGIPNAKSFNEIISIEDAQKLWERIKEKQEENKWQPDLEEEYEDEEGAFCTEFVLEGVGVLIWVKVGQKRKLRWCSIPKPLDCPLLKPPCY
ncbi:hypothetical protein L1987_75971 [Smallanthus sonchifolius]|uniref:Uncharacterized protein n=1 Tax=Smallanthus sonchifolius TaxID=185202 RepID=A0ACB9ABC0_9ASTR|nr:hypothetical protein L1987_75971 [Smallanthus sonchifolius]